MKQQYLERGLLKNFDFALLGLTLLISAFGVIAIYSANLQSDSSYLKELYIRQAVWILISLAALFVTIMIDYKTLARFAYPLFFIGIALLVAVDFAGATAGGSRRWLSMGGLNLQPSEPMKIIVIILIARILDDIDKKDGLGFIELIKPVIFTLIPFLLIARQPDLGTAVIYIVIFAGVVLFNGISVITFYVTAGGLAIFTPLSWLFLKPYQKDRILTLLNPEADPMGVGYHIIQSKIAVGSGGVWGKGIFSGTQSKLNFLPEKHTDFIFPVVAEEIGFLGSLILIAMMFFLIIRVLDIALESRDRFGALILVGSVTMISFHMLYNIGMTLGLFPIVGVPLPFISYGGSSLITNFIAIGLALNVAMRRFQIE